jgi:tRNA-2-methylthio-N6-dimethylallyladenosine synthase
VELQRLQAKVQIELFEAMVGQEMMVLVDGTSRRDASELAGKTDGWVTVNFAGAPSLIGRLVPVRICAAGNNSVRGELIGGDHAH